MFLYRARSIRNLLVFLNAGGLFSLPMMAGAQQSGAPAASPINYAFMAGELLIALLLWAVLSGLFFQLFWSAFSSPFVAIRGAYLVSTLALLTYLLVRFYPRYMSLWWPDGSHLRYVAAVLLILVLALVCYVTYRKTPQRGS